VCGTAANTGGVKFTRDISRMCLLGQRGNRRSRQKIGFDCAALIGDCRAYPIDRGGHWLSNAYARHAGSSIL